MLTSKIPSGTPIAQAIDKEQVKLLRFSTEDVLADKQEALQRGIDLKRAEAVGASAKSNVKIFLISFSSTKKSAFSRTASLEITPPKPMIFAPTFCASKSKS